MTETVVYVQTNAMRMNHLITLVLRRAIISFHVGISYFNLIRLVDNSDTPADTSYFHTLMHKLFNQLCNYTSLVIHITLLSHYVIKETHPTHTIRNYILTMRISFSQSHIDPTFSDLYPAKGYNTIFFHRTVLLARQD